MDRGQPHECDEHTGSNHDRTHLKDAPQSGDLITTAATAIAIAGRRFSDAPALFGGVIYQRLEQPTGVSWAVLGQ